MEKSGSSHLVRKIIVFLLSISVIIGAFYYVYNFTDYLDGIIPKYYSITFDIDGEDHIQKVKKNEMPVYDGTDDGVPLKKTETKTYAFIRWEPEIVQATKNAKYVAIFSSEAEDRHYSVLATSEYESGYSISGVGSDFLFNDPATLSVAINPGFEFKGWYLNGSLYSENQTIEISKITENLNFEVRVEPISYNITFQGLKPSAINPNKTTYTVLDGELALQNATVNGYSFQGWKNESNQIVSSINSSEMRNRTLTATWSLINYSISYKLNGGTVSGLNPTTYTIESPDITLKNPTKNPFEFLGWSEGDSDEYKTTMKIESGSFGDKVFTAHFNDGRNITLIVEGITLQEKATASYGQTAIFPEIMSEKYGMQGYRVEKWFIDSACQTEFNHSTPIYADSTLYGKWTYLLNNGFYKYLSKFNQSLSTKSLTISSRDELRRFIEFVQFHELDETQSPRLTIEVSNSLDFIQEEVNKSNYPYMGTLRYSYANSEVKSIFVSEKIKDIECSEKLEENESRIYSQKDYAYKLNLSQTRDNDFNNFNINKVSDEIEVETSNQLVYALECGLKPICKSGSKAEYVLQKAKQVLIKIINDDMTDLEKVNAIYEWLVFNVEYDNLAFANSVNNSSFDAKKYRSWYAEGVFDEGIAVCDGIAKAFVVLAKLENIPIVRVEGDEHAWNKVWIDGVWYGIDATQGNVLVNGSYEILSYTNFLFTDEYKTSCGYTSTIRSEISATTVYDYYSNFKINSYDLCIDSATELKEILKLKKNYSSTLELSGFTIEFAISSSAGVDLSNNSSVTEFIRNCLSGAGFYVSYSIVGLSEAEESGAVYSSAGHRVFTLIIG